MHPAKQMRLKVALKASKQLVLIWAYIQDESQNPRMAWAGRDQSGSSGSISLLQQGHPKAQDFVQMVLEYVQWGRLHALPGLSFSPGHCTVKNLFLVFRWNFLSISFSLFLLFNCSASLRRAWSILWHVPSETRGFCFPSSFPKLLTIFSVLFHLLNHYCGTTLNYFLPVSVLLDRF